MVILCSLWYKSALCANEANLSRFHADSVRAHTTDIIQKLLPTSAVYVFTSDIASFSVYMQAVVWLARLCKQLVHASECIYD